MSGYVQYVYVWANGVVGIGSTSPQGSIPIAFGTRARLEEAVLPFCNLSADNHTYLIPNAANGIEDALAAFCADLRRLALSGVALV